MNNVYGNVRLIGLSSVILFAVWIVTVTILAPFYQNTAGSNPLAMLDVLFPFFWVILLSFVGLGFVAFLKSTNPRWLHMLLLAQFSLMLFYTPFLLSGFSWSPDSLWHGGVASYLPQIFSGSDVALSGYAHAYPLSFFVTYLVELTGLDIFTFSLYVYPVACTVLFSVLAYFFASRMLGPKTAFLAMLITLPALHYIEMHVSPFSAGTILFFASLIFFTYESKLSKALGLSMIVLLVIVHPISPIMLAVYFFSLALVGLFVKQEGTVKSRWSKFSNIFLLVFTGGLWIFWTLYASSVYVGMQTSVASLYNLSFFSRIFLAADFATGGAGFIYPWIHNLSLAIYGFLLVLFFVGNIPGYKNIRHFFGRVHSVLTFRRLSFMFAAVIFAALGFLLFISSGERFLLGRGLLYFIFFGSMALAPYFVSQSLKRQKVKTVAAFVLVVFLVCTFPVISYSKEAYNTFTPSANAGLSFLTSHTNLSEKSVSMSSSQQLASYANLSDGLNIVRFPPNMADEQPDVIAMRVNGYFLISMRNDLSFTNNSFTQLNDFLDHSSNYDKVYSNSQFEVYLK